MFPEKTVVSEPTPHFFPEKRACRRKKGSGARIGFEETNAEGGGEGDRSHVLRIGSRVETCFWFDLSSFVSLRVFLWLSFMCVACTVVYQVPFTCR